MHNERNFIISTTSERFSDEQMKDELVCACSTNEKGYTYGVVTGNPKAGISFVR